MKFLPSVPLSAICKPTLTWHWACGGVHHSHAQIDTNKIKYQLGYLVLVVDHYPTALGLNNQLRFSNNFDGKLYLYKSLREFHCVILYVSLTASTRAGMDSTSQCKLVMSFMITCRSQGTNECSTFHIFALLLLSTVSEHFFHLWSSWFCYLRSSTWFL